MNYNFPYYGMMPLSRMAGIPTKTASGGILSRLFSGVNIGSILSNTQKTLNVVNQTIPLVKQVSPLIKNAKTMFSVMNEFKKIDIKEETTNTNIQSNLKQNNIQKISNEKEQEQKEQNTKNKNDGLPVFFID